MLLARHSGAAGDFGRESETLTYTDTVNRVLGPLKSTPTDAFEVDILSFQGPAQEESLDYSVREVQGGTAPGWYVCVSPTSTAPGGGVFGGGVNPSTGIAGVLSPGLTAQAIRRRPANSIY